MQIHKGKCQLVKKYEGYGIMVQDLQYRQFFFGYPLKVPYLQTINGYHALHTKYVDTYATTTILGHNHKEPITMGRNNVCQEFEYGESDEGYWNYERTVPKIEYCTKILKDLYPIIYFIFLFDHP